MPCDLDVAAVHATLDNLFKQLGPRFIIGLSGGGDSMALAHLCAQWAAHCGAHVTALIIDHGLRREAGLEAKQVQSWAQALGLAANIYSYEGPKFTSRIQERARQVRHHAFAQAALDMGGATILLAHTLDDQAETIAFRLARQTGLDGLAGMAPVTFDLVSHAAVARPLLGVRREALRAYLNDVGQAWIEDPSNQNRQFARIRVRDRLAQLGCHEHLARIGALAQTLREAQVEATFDLARRCDLTTLGAQTRFQARPFLGAAPVVKSRLMSQLIGGDWPVPPDKVARLVVRMAQGDFKRATLGKKQISRRNDVFCVEAAPVRRTRVQA